MAEAVTRGGGRGAGGAPAGAEEEASSQLNILVMVRSSLADRAALSLIHI